jgi:hypothetical protein
MNARPDPAAMVVSVRTIGLAAVAALTAASAGCGGGSATAGSAPTPPAATTTSASRPAAAAATPTARDTCTMLTADQVTSALGEPAGPGKPEPDFDTPECEWQPLSGHNGTVTLDVGPWEGDPGVKPLKLGTALAGVGDEAYDAGNTGLYVRKGSNGLRVWVFNVSTQSSRLDLEKQLAAIVLAHI